MTENEAIKAIQNDLEWHSKELKPAYKEVLRIAIQALEEIQAYREIGTIEEFKALKEKSVAKKPNQVSKAMDKDKYVGLIGRCPNCSSIVAEDNLVCEDCFQVLDWSE